MHSHRAFAYFLRQFVSDSSINRHCNMNFGTDGSPALEKFTSLSVESSLTFIYYDR